MYLDGEAVIVGLKTDSTEFKNLLIQPSDSLDINLSPNIEMNLTSIGRSISETTPPILIEEEARAMAGDLDQSDVIDESEQQSIEDIGDQIIQNVQTVEMEQDNTKVVIPYNLVERPTIPVQRELASEDKEDKKEQELAIESDQEQLDTNLNEEVEHVANEAEEVLNNAQEDDLSDSEMATLAVTIEETEEEVAELEEEVAKDPASEDLNSDLAQAKADLAAATAALNKKDAEIEALKAQKVSLEKAYCDQQDSLSDLTTRVEEFENTAWGALTERFDTLSQLLMMNMLGSQGPQLEFEQGMTHQNPRYAHYGLQNGINMLSLSDLFNARSLGGVNIYNVGGNFYGGAYNHNPVTGDYYNGAYSYNPAATSPMNMAAQQNVNFPMMNRGLNFPSMANDFSYNFMNGVADSARFTPTFPMVNAGLIERNIDRMNNGQQIFDRAPSQQNEETAPEENQNLL